MALGRNLTKRLQRLRSKSNDLNRDGAGDDGFVSISFEQTTDCSNTPTTTSPTMSNTPENNHNDELTTCSSGSSTNSGPREPITPSDLALEAQRIYSESTANGPIEYFGDQPKSAHRHTPSGSSSIYSTTKQPQPPPEKPVDMDARADEMAMDILEKVSADDYLREIRTGSWYIQ